MSTASARPLWAGRALALVGIVLVAFNLRTAVASLSPVLVQLERDIPLTALTIGVLGTLPPLCYAVFGLTAPVLARRFGLERSLIIALVALAAGLVWRGLPADAWTLLAASTLTFASIGVGNVLLPPLVKRYFPDRIGLMTTIYVTAMSVSTFVPPLVAVPVADATSWRASLAMWGVIALVAIVPWVALLVHPRRTAPAVLPEEARPALFRHALRSPLAWSLAVVFAASGFNAYAMFAWLPRILVETAGVTAAGAGALLALYAAMGLPAGLAVPIIAARFGRIRLLVGIGVASLVAGYLGLILAPASVPWLWVSLAGIGPLLFPLALVLINLRTRSHAGAVALSAFVQSVGYVIVAVGPLAVGVLHDAVGGWNAPLVFLAASAVPAAVCGVVVSRPKFFEDERGRPRASSRS